MTETTTIPDDRRGGPGGLHVGDLKLRRLRAGESLGADGEWVAAHLGSCPDCTRRLDGIAAEQRAFEHDISFDRFAAGVERAERVPSRAVVPGRRWWSRPASTRSFVTVMGVGAAASIAALVFGVRPLFDAAHVRRAATTADATNATNRIKGGDRAEITVRVAAPDTVAQRIAAADAPEPLATGERIRVGVKSGAHRYLFAISLDDNGGFTPLYPEDGTSVEVAPRAPLKYLPDSLELTGRGFETLIVLLTDEPLALDGVRAAAAAAFARSDHNLLQLPSLVLPGEQFHRTFLKP